MYMGLTTRLVNNEFDRKNVHLWRRRQRLMDGYFVVDDSLLIIVMFYLENTYKLGPHSLLTHYDANRGVRLLVKIRCV